MADNTLREYLTRLGFKVDEDSYNKFNAVLTRTTKGVMALGEETVAASTAVTLAIKKISDQYASLYYVSQRTGSTVAGLKSFEFGARQIGVAADQSRAQVEAFGSAIRNNPGLRGLLRSMGIDPSDAQRASVALVGRLRSQFGERGYFAASRMAEMFGFDEQTFRQLWTNYETLKRQQEEYDRRLQQSGVDTKKLADESIRFDRALNGLLASFGLIADQTAGKWLPTMTSGLEVLDGWAKALLDLGVRTEGWSSSIATLVTALGGLKAASWLLSLLGIGSGKIGLGTAARGALALGGGLIGGGIAGAMLLGSTQPANAAETKYYGADGKPTKDGARAFVIDQFMTMGWSREAATGLAANFYRESKFDPRAVGDGGKAVGVGQWHPDRQANFKRVFGKDLQDASLREQIQFADWELRNTEKGAGDRLRGARTAAEAGDIASRYYERPRDTQSEARMRADLAQRWFDGGLTPAGGAGGAQVQITQKTDIHVQGSDAKQTADMVVDAQNRVNGDMVRNTRGAVR